MKTPQDLWTERSRDLATALSRSALGDRTAFKQVYDLSSGHLLR